MWEPLALLAWAMTKWSSVVGVDLLGEAPAAENHTVPHRTTGADSSRMNVISVAFLAPKTQRVSKNEGLGVWVQHFLLWPAELPR